MNRVLLFGGGGLLGSTLQRQWQGVQFVVPSEQAIDITEAAAVRQAAEEASADVIINCAAWNDVDGAEEYEADATSVNALAVRNMAAVARDLGLPIVHFSTDYVFDGTDLNGYAEDAPAHPINAYGRSKALGEQYLRQETEQHYLIRTSRLYGAPARSPRAKMNFVARISHDASQAAEIRSVDEEPGAFTLADDLAAALRRLLDDQVPFGTYHLTAAGEATWFQCAKEIVRLMRLPCRVIPVSRSAYPVRRQIPPYTVLRSTKVPHLRHWKEALADFLGRAPGA